MIMFTFTFTILFILYVFRPREINEYLVHGKIPQIMSVVFYLVYFLFFSRIKLVMLQDENFNIILMNRISKLVSMLRKISFAR